MAPIKRSMSIGNTSPVVKILILFALRSPWWYCCLCFAPVISLFLLVWSHCFAPGTHQEQDYQNLTVCSPWHINMPQKIFSTMPCPIDLSISHLVAQKVQPIMAHGMGKTVSHTIFIMAL